MRSLKMLTITLLLLVLLACGKPVPPDKTAFVGEWKGQNMRLLITKEGRVKYERVKEGATTSIDAPLQGFEGDNFSVGVGPLATKFIVTTPPHEYGAEWKMVVDGVELSRDAN